MTSRGVDVGANIRAFRKRRRLSLNDLSRITGISASNLSSMELGKSSPTLSTLAKIAAAFDMKAGVFLDQVLYSNAILCRRGEGHLVEKSAPAASMRLLTAEVRPNGMEASHVDLRPGCKALSAGRAETDRLVYCLRGEVGAVAEDDTYLLNEGDSLYILAGARAELGNPSTEEASVLIVALKFPTDCSTDGKR